MEREGWDTQLHGMEGEKTRREEKEEACNLKGGGALFFSCAHGHLLPLWLLLARGKTTTKEQRAVHSEIARELSISL